MLEALPGYGEKSMKRERTLSGAALAAVLLLPISAAARQQEGAPQQDDPELAEIEKMVRERSEDPFKALGQREIEGIRKGYGEKVFTFFFDDDLVPRPYLVAAQVSRNTDPQTIARHYGQILGCLREQFFLQYGAMLELKEITRPVVVLVFGSLDDYLEISSAKPELGLFYVPGLGGYFNQATGFLYMWEQPNLWEVMFHEGTHQLVFHASAQFSKEGMTASPWLQEGIAEYFGGHEKELLKEGEEWRYRFTFGGLLKGRYASARNAIYQQRAMSVKELVYLDQLEFLKVRADPTKADQLQQVYALGWALVMFLNQAGEGRYAAEFREILNAEVRGELDGGRFGEALLLEEDEDWADFDAEFRAWVMRELGSTR